MNNFERIKNMPLIKMAEDRIYSIQEYAGALIEYYGDFKGSCNNRKEALKKEIEWLRKEC